MVSITIALPEDQWRQLQEKAARLGISPEELVQVTIPEILSRSEKDFNQALDYVLDKNTELYKRLA